MPLSHRQFDTDQLPLEERFGTFAGAMATTHDVLRVEGDTRPFHADADCWFLGEMFLTFGRQTGVRYRRSAERINADGLDTVTILLLVEGHWAGRMGGQEYYYGPGCVVANDYLATMDITSSDNQNISLEIPRKYLPPAIAAIRGFHGVAFSEAAGRLLAGHLMSLRECVHELSEANLPAVTQMTSSILAAAFATRLAGRRSETDHPLLSRALRYIENNLNGALTPEKVAGALSVSRSTLYEAFKPMGGLAAYVMRRRLEAIHVLLRDTSDSQSISGLARRFGFRNDTHFSAAFRRQFGFSPRQARKMSGKEIYALLPDLTEQDIREWRKKSLGALKTTAR